MAGAVSGLVAAAAAEKPAAAKPTAITLTIDAADRTALTRAQASALARARLTLKGPFNVLLAWGGASEEAGESEDEAKPGAPGGAAAAA